MDDLPILSPKTLVDPNRRRKEWVKLPSGRVCIWEMTMADGQWVIDRSRRPREDPRGGSDPVMAGIFEVLVSSYDGDEPSARRIFGEGDMQAISNLSHAEFVRLEEAIARVNFLSAEEEEDLSDFTTATEAQLTSA